MSLTTDHNPKFCMTFKMTHDKGELHHTQNVKIAQCLQIHTELNYAFQLEVTFCIVRPRHSTQNSMCLQVKVSASRNECQD